MPYLGDYLGQLLSEIVTARAHADLESIRVAELYASHPHLKHFPVPHLRLPTITLDLAYAVEQSEQVPVGESPRGTIDLGAMLKGFGTLLTAAIARHGIQLSKKTRDGIDASLVDFVRRSKVPHGSAVALRSAAGDMTDVVINLLLAATGRPSKRQSSDMRAFADDLKEAAYTEFISLRTLPPRVMVLVTKKDLLEIKNPDLLSRLHLTISEEGQEWTVVDADGKPRERLIPE